MAQSYSDYIVAQSKRHPCLRNLSRFMLNDIAKQDCRIVSLGFFAQDEKPRRTDLDLWELEALLDAEVSGCQGRIIIIEDLSKAVIETLGWSLDIDPLFFASQIHGPTMDVASSKPSIAILPSRSLTQNFLSVQYQRPVDFDACSIAPRKMLCNSNVPRRLVLLPPMKNIYIGLEQQSCSILLSSTKSPSWLEVILVDKPTSEKYTTPDMQLVLPSRPFQGGYEDFSERRSVVEPDSGGPGRISLLEDLVYYWEKERPPAFQPEQPTLLSLTYYPLKIAAGEWVSYIAVMSNSIKQYEYSTEAPLEEHRLRKIDSDLRSLEVWGRRCLQSSSKLQSVINFLKYQNKGDTDHEQHSLLIRDFEYIAALVDAYGRRLEIIVPVVISVLQISDTRRSLKEAANVTRLTNLALLFVPLSFVASLLVWMGVCQGTISPSTLL
ncbi:hypothetical protein B0O99DRAFT_690880 [Bisporella sp. PMI_857]|nr:hypothetical protein B0O99DRAFT_690880 [Bisporella sp. PMI_857]